ncbi:hypothetical protein M514_20585 [Trichuris suis]|uniref:Uncharacterized protein n=1 Tax=Trichuris suis TaxID=68888 RepID=A0A085LKR4_9BILA|nr:hypothetical protein M513_13561 [Trichuris suis]KFD45560.1 hypothetical protein M513_13562 [Trichuris suis]KFD67149.1 hypothetical protein M514_20585 [Trichuris suis]
MLCLCCLYDCRNFHEIFDEKFWTDSVSWLRMMTRDDVKPKASVIETSMQETDTYRDEMKLYAPTKKSYVFNH